MKNTIFTTFIFISLIFAQTSSITIGGTGSAATSAHITIGTNGYKCPTEYVVQAGASLTAWDPSAICGASTSGGGDIALPVELSEFTAEQVGSSVVVRWTTESEIDNIGFILDRKQDDNTDWVCITDYKQNSDLLGYGTTSEYHDYEYTDNLVEANKTYYYRLADVSMDNVVEYHDKISIAVEAIEKPSVPDVFALHPAYPNPFNPVTNIRFDIPEDSEVTITIFNEMGNMVRVLTNVDYRAGHHSLAWDSKNDHGQRVCAGVYLYRIETDKYQKTMKMVLLK